MYSSHTLFFNFGQSMYCSDISVCVFRFIFIYMRLCLFFSGTCFHTEPDSRQEFFITQFWNDEIFDARTFQLERKFELGMKATEIFLILRFEMKILFKSKAEFKRELKHLFTKVTHYIKNDKETLNSVQESNIFILLLCFKESCINIYVLERFVFGV